jgi:hypothetical protein
MRLTSLAHVTLAVILSAPALAQEPIKATTDTGQVVLLFPDGTWKYKSAVAEPGAPNKGHVKSPAATERLVLNGGKVSLSFDPKKWQKAKGEEPAMQGFTHLRGDGYAKLIYERLQMPLATLKQVALANAKEAAPDLKVVSEEKRVVNGRQVLCMQLKGTIQGIPFVYLAYYYAGKEGSIQVLTFTGENLFSEYRTDFEEFLNGLVIGP